MIKKILFFSFLLFVTILNAQVKRDNLKGAYIIQLFVVTDLNITKKEILKRIPHSLRDKIHIHKIDGKIIGCYAQASSYKALKRLLKRVKKEGYKDAYIRKTKVCFMQTRSSNAELTIVKKRKRLSKYEITDLISKAQKAYKNHLYNQAILYYEKLIDSGFKSKDIMINLSYLYGIFGKWKRFRYIITSKKYPTIFVYAYANGALKGGQKNFYKNLKEFIEKDYSGHLDILAGYFFEQKGDDKKALKFYKSAYQKNPTDLYNKFAFARILDIVGKKDEAYKLYKEIYYATTQDSTIHKTLAKILD